MAIAAAAAAEGIVTIHLLLPAAADPTGLIRLPIALLLLHLRRPAAVRLLPAALHQVAVAAEAAAAV